MKTTKEHAKATQEVAKTAHKALEVTEKFGGFIAERVGGSLEQAMGIFEDKLKFYRAERQLRLMSRVQELAKEKGMQYSIKPIPLKIAIPILEAASIEDDDYLQDMWANLIVNASDALEKESVQRVHISILEQLTPLEAKILEVIYSIDFHPTDEINILTHKLPEEAPLVENLDAINVGVEKTIEPSDEIKMALANLSRLRCLALPTTFNGREIFHHVNPTLLGQRFIQACTL